jgi:hypothetical protein
VVSISDATPGIITAILADHDSDARHQHRNV